MFKIERQNKPIPSKIIASLVLILLRMASTTVATLVPTEIHFIIVLIINNLLVNLFLASKSNHLVVKVK